jgi:ferric-dicitrate binding protein FerR (iron transport regulator)
MRARSWISIAAALALPALVAGGGAVRAQDGTGGCTVEQVGGTSRHIVRCRSGLSATAEAGASYAVLDRDRDGNADAMRLDSGGLLLEYSPKGSGGSVEVIAPQAIAAVRGTKWAVDAQPGRTSVFVVTGSVAVRRPSGGNTVTLHTGEGVDADQGGGPLVVKRWGSARVSALLARFGQ